MKTNRVTFRYVVVAITLFIINYVIFLGLYLVMRPTLGFFVPYATSYILSLIISHDVYWRAVFLKQSAYTKSLVKYFSGTLLVSSLSLAGLTVLEIFFRDAILIGQFVWLCILGGLSFLLAKNWAFVK